MGDISFLPCLLGDVPAVELPLCSCFLHLLGLVLEDARWQWFCFGGKPHFLEHQWELQVFGPFESKQLLTVCRHIEFKLVLSIGIWNFWSCCQVFVEINITENLEETGFSVSLGVPGFMDPSLPARPMAVTEGSLILSTKLEPNPRLIFDYIPLKIQHLVLG